MESGTIEDQFHSYVRPTRCPILSDFCVDLTGITQRLIDGQDPFPSVYAKFHAWIERIKSEKGLHFATPSEKQANDNDGPNATFCSWSNWDLEFYLKKEMQQAGINIPSLFKAWIDVRLMFNVSWKKWKKNC